MAKPIAVEATLTVPFSAEQLWPYVADTDRLDRSVGLPPVNFSRGEVARDEPDVGEYRLWRFPIARWIENPFEWQRPRRFSVVREYQSGPLIRFCGGTELLPSGAGTTLRVFAEFLPKPWAVPLVRRAIAPLSMKRSVRQFRAIASFLSRESSQPFPQLADARARADSGRLQDLLGQLNGKGLQPPTIELLRALLGDAADEDVASMRPLELARSHGLDPQETLRTFLEATVLGLLEMRWEMLCPACRGVKADASHLNELKAEAHCSACNLDFRPDVDELIEARFYPARAVRPVEVDSYCVSSPVKTPHRLLQGLVDPGQVRQWSITLEAGGYNLRSPQTRASHRIAVAAEGAGKLDATFESMLVLPESSELREGPTEIVVRNETGRRLTVVVDQAHTPATAATPARLMTLPAFQSLFSAEALAPGIELQVSRVGLLFTDLAGSTALYERVGEARAFRLVTDHFAVLRRAIEEAGGAVIKSIGDAMMAAFTDGRLAFDAALRIQRYILELDARGVIDDLSHLVKVGVHAGACFAVTQNERLDYFGTAVNVAARAQHEAKGGEIVATAEAFEEGKALLAESVSA
ncbi:MAG: hypothetical protein KGJ86_14085, partial [Chloroflexota bacterium]|nr:hypothetical protein [Chloroflexota bacterium]